MNWNTIRDALVKVGLPALGAAVGGPAGFKIGGMIAEALGVNNDAAAVQQALVSDPDAAVKLRSIEAQVQIATIQAEAAQVASVNQTLQTEAMGGSFWQRNHHAFESTFTVLLVAGIYIGLPAFGVPVPTVPGDVWVMLGAILGVTAWQRGAANVATVKGGSDGA